MGATANLNNPLADHNPEYQSFFVRMGSNGMNVVPRSEVRVKECRDVSTGDFETMDSTLELVEVEKIVGLVRNNGCTTESSSGEKFVQLLHQSRYLRQFLYTACIREYQGGLYEGYDQYITDTRCTGTCMVF